MDPVQYLNLKLPADTKEVIDNCSEFPAHVDWPATNTRTLTVICKYLQRLEHVFSTEKHGILWKYTSGNNFTLAHGSCTFVEWIDGKLNGSQASFRLRRDPETKLLCIAANSELNERDQQLLMWHANMLIDTVQHIGTHNSQAKSFVQMRLPLAAVSCNCRQKECPPLGESADECDDVAREAVLRLLNFYTRHADAPFALTHTAGTSNGMAWANQGQNLVWYKTTSDDEPSVLELQNINSAEDCQLHIPGQPAMPFCYSICVPQLNSTPITGLAKQLYQGVQVQRNPNASHDDARNAVQQFLKCISQLQ